MFHFEIMAIISIVGSALLSDIICIILLVGLILDPYNTPQGLDYCLFSLVISDLLQNLMLGTLSICSSIVDHWMFGNNACKLFACTAYALWLVDIMSLFWLSVDRYLFITDIKYSTHKMRTKARFICKIVLSWFLSAVYSFAPIAAQKTGRYLKHSFVCILNSINLEAYYLTVTLIVVLPCFLGTHFNFGRIFLMRFRYATQRNQSKLSEADVELLMNPNHKMSAYLAIIFFISWTPYTVHLLVGSDYDLNLFEYWIGNVMAIWRLPILTLCPRYRPYFNSFISSVKREQSTTSLQSDGCEKSPTPPPDNFNLHI